MRILAIGDIHGCRRAFDALLGAVELTGTDTLITLGDYIDRGPDSSGVIDRLIALDTVCRLVPLLGNHEEMLLHARHNPHAKHNWLMCGGKETLASYSPVPDAGKLVDIPDAHWRFFESCKDWHATSRHVFVHANLYPEADFEHQPSYMLRWEKLDEPIRHRSGKVMVCGHTRQRNGLPLVTEHTICIDTGAYSGGWLTCLDVNSGKIWQADELGDVRTLHANDCSG